MGERDSESDREAFERAMANVERVDSGRPQIGGRALGARGGRARRRERSEGRATAPEFELTRHGRRVEGRQVDLEPERWARLKRGEIEPRNRLDLHGMSEEAARHEVFRFLRQSRVSGLECVALVHGRGLRSPAGPVLKERLPEWLTQLPLAREVLAFAAAPPGRGGDGVTLVLVAVR